MKRGARSLVILMEYVDIVVSLPVAFAPGPWDPQHCSFCTSRLSDISSWSSMIQTDDGLRLWKILLPCLTPTQCWVVTDYM